MTTVHKNTVKTGLQITRDGYHWGAAAGRPSVGRLAHDHKRLGFDLMEKT